MFALRYNIRMQWITFPLTYVYIYIYTRLHRLQIGIIICSFQCAFIHKTHIRYCICANTFVYTNTTHIRHIQTHTNPYQTSNNWVAIHYPWLNYQNGQENWTINWGLHFVASHSEMSWIWAYCICSGFCHLSNVTSWATESKDSPCPRVIVASWWTRDQKQPFRFTIFSHYNYGDFLITIYFHQLAPKLYD